MNPKTFAIGVVVGVMLMVLPMKYVHKQGRKSMLSQIYGANVTAVVTVETDPIPREVITSATVSCVKCHNTGTPDV